MFDQCFPHLTKRFPGSNPKFPGIQWHFLDFSKWLFSSYFFVSSAQYSINCKLKYWVVACESVVHVHVSTHNVRISRNFLDFCFHFPEKIRISRNSGNFLRSGNTDIKRQPLPIVLCSISLMGWFLYNVVATLEK